MQVLAEAVGRDVHPDTRLTCTRACIGSAGDGPADHCDDVSSERGQQVRDQQVRITAVLM